jgi:ABC-type transport system involved in multi-copper enzyme maturation permease subunit
MPPVTNVGRWLLTLLPLNPICVRLVQSGSRRLRHLYIRSAYLGVLIIVLLILLLQSNAAVQNYRDLAAAGAAAFQWVAYLQLGLICILTPVFMAGAIAQESNPKNWDVLLTTPLSTPQIVLGNLFGRLFFVLALLACSLPLFAITQYFGGVPGRTVFLGYIVSAAAALLVGAIAIALAVNRLAGRRAVFTFYAAVVSYIGVTWAIDLALRPGSPAGQGGVTALTPLNPFLSLEALLRPSSYPRPDAVQLADMGPISRWWFGSPVAAWCWISIGLSLTLSLVSSFTLRQVGASQGIPWYRRMFGLGASGADTRPAREVWNNPVAWREAAARANTLPKLLARWGFIVAGIIWGVGLTIAYHRLGLDHEGYRFALLATFFTEFAVIALIAINMSATAISREREDGTLDLLLTTPLSQADYLNGKLRGLISYLAPLLAVPVGTMAIAGLYVFFGGFGRDGGVSFASTVVSSTRGTLTVNAPVVLPEIALTLPIVTIAFIAFAIIVGLQWSLMSRGTIGSVVATVAVVGLVGSIVGVCGWQAGTGISSLGPFLTAFTPPSLAYASLNPLAALRASITGQEDVGSARIVLAAGAIGTGIAYLMIVLAMKASMAKTFDATTRRLAGTR